MRNKKKKWSEIFSEHPEFFRVSSKSWVSLRWRHALEENFDPETNTIVKPDKTKNLTRKPLDNTQIETLISIAVEMHHRAIEHEKEKRWLTPFLFSLLGIVLGIILKTAMG